MPRTLERMPRTLEHLYPRVGDIVLETDGFATIWLVLDKKTYYKYFEIRRKLTSIREAPYWINYSNIMVI